MSYEINEENLKLKFDEENPLMPNWEVYEQISGLSRDEIPTKGKMGLLISTHFREVKEFLDEDEIKSYKSAIEQISKMSESEYEKFVVDTIALYKDFLKNNKKDELECSSFFIFQIERLLMDYQRKLNNATTLLLIQIIYNEAFEKATQEIEETFVNENLKQRLVYTDGSVDPSLVMTDCCLRISAEMRALKLFGKNKNGTWIKSRFEAFVGEKKKELIENQKNKKGGLGNSPNLKVKHMKNSKRKFLFFLCFLLFFASVYTLAMLATVEGAVPGPTSEKTDTVGRRSRLVAYFREVKMKKAKRERDIPILFMVTETEKKKILSNSKKAGIKYYTNYIRKMALHGLILKKDYSELVNVSGALGQISYEFNQIGNNINQIAKKANETEEFNQEDFEKLHQEFKNFKARFRKMEREFFVETEADMSRLEKF